MDDTNGERGAEGATAGLVQLEAIVDRILSVGMWQLSDAETVEAVRRTAIVARKVQAAQLAAIAELDGRPGAVSGAPGKHQSRGYLQAVLRRTKGQAKQDAAAAQALRADADPGQGGLPRLGAAFGAGQVSREHVDAAVRVVATLPKRLLPALMVDEDGSPILDARGIAMCAGDVVDERLTRYAQEHDSHALAQIGKQLKSALDPDGDFDPGQCLRRSVRFWFDHAGMFQIRGELDPAAGAIVAAALDFWGNPRRYAGADENGELIDLPDPRTEGQRKADAVLDMAKAAMASLRSGTRGGEPPRVNLTTRPEDLAAARAADAARRTARSRGSRDGETGDGGESRSRTAFFSDRADDPDWPGDGGQLGTGSHASPRLVARLSCDSVLQRVLLAPNGAVLDLGREVRTVTPAQRRALIARDKGCVIPGCTVPAAWTEGHHVEWWSAGGRSDIANLALLCAQHHTETHTGIWVLVMKDGIPWVIPPDWLDSEQRPRRNLFHRHVQDARDQGTQLRINLENGTTRAAGPWSPASSGPQDPDRDADSNTDTDTSRGTNSNPDPDHPPEQTA